MASQQRKNTARKPASARSRASKAAPRAKGGARGAKPAARTPRQEKNPQPRVTVMEIAGLLIIGMGIVSVIVLLTIDSEQNIVRTILGGLSGLFSYVTCAVLIWIGLLCAFVGRKQINARRVSMMGAAILLVYGMVHLFYAHGIMGDLLIGGGYLNFIRASFMDRAGTGAIGALLCYPVYQAFGMWAGFAVLLVLLLTDIVLMKQISPREVGEKAHDYLQKNYEHFREQQAERAAQRQLIRDEREAAREASRGRYNRRGESWNDMIYTPEDDYQSDISDSNRPADDAHADDGQEGLFVERPAYGERRPLFEMPADPVEDEPVSDEPAVDIPAPLTSADDAEDGKSADIRSEAEDLAAEDEPPTHEGHDEDQDEDQDFELDGDEGIFDGFDALTGSGGFELPKKRDRHAEALAAADPFAETEVDETTLPMRERRIDHTPIVPGKADLSHDLKPTGQVYNYPPVDLLALPKPSVVNNLQAKDQEKAKKLEETLRSFGIEATLKNIAHGPAVTRFELAPAPGVKVSRITALSDDIALNLAAESIRIEAPIPGKAAVGVEVPNDKIETVPLREVLESQEARRNPSKLAAAMGKDNSGRYIVADIAKMPHVLIAGATGSGKSVCINCIICSILYRATPDEVRLIMVDPKMVELSVYNDIPHLLQPVVTDPKKASAALHWAVQEMTNRYKLFKEKGVRNIKGYNSVCEAEGEPQMPQIVIIIDELADLMMVAPGEVEDSICRLAQLARAAGIHLVIATQRPSVNVITGVIKANIPARIAFTVASSVDSRTILDVGGAEKLLGRGDMLFNPTGSNKMQRVQGAWVSDEEINAIVEYIKDRCEPDYNSDLLEYMKGHDSDKDEEEEEGEGRKMDKLMPEALEAAINAGQVSVSMLQRKFSIGYARAGRLVDDMATRGYVSQAEGSKPRNVLITREQYLQLFGKKEDGLSA